MYYHQALRIVHELAAQNVITDDMVCDDPDLKQEQARQEEALIRVDQLRDTLVESDAEVEATALDPT